MLGGVWLGGLLSYQFQYLSLKLYKRIIDSNQEQSFYLSVAASFTDSTSLLQNGHLLLWIHLF